MGLLLKNKLVYAIIPARSGSKGLPDKNIKDIEAKPLISYSISFAKALNIDRVFCSTDSDEYAKIAINYGAEVPFLRSEKASSDTAMEHDILEDLYDKFKKEGIEQPDYIVWLRPTFVFRSIDDIKNCINKLEQNSDFTSARTVCESENRLYSLDKQGRLDTTFEDDGKSMIRRQDVPTSYKVYSTDIIRSKPENISNTFLGNNVYGVKINKICGLDIDDIFDFKLVELIIKHERKLVEQYLF
ncbi:MAG: acylneuraminate cytidylyltransferase family protein [Flavobacteriaceae bacterium]|nr:acylneuraminate cytidylyltransferase family protein [Flavobacteriaceae bacterium]